MDRVPPTDASNLAGGSLRARVVRWAQSVVGYRRWRDRPLSELLGIDRGVLVQALKIALSAGLSWALAGWLLSSPSPIWAPITASLIALLTVRASIRDAIEKVVAVLIGIAVAIWLGGLIGLHAWSIAVIVAVGFLVGKMLRLNGGAAAQIPINGLFVLALGTTDTGQVTQRFLDTLIGAGVAVAVNFAVVPPNYVSAASRSVAALADGLVDVLTGIAGGILRPWTYDNASGWLRRAREQGRFATAAEADAEKASQSLRLHPGRASWENALDRLQQANDTLQIVEVQVRTLARTVRDIATKMPARDGSQPPMPMASAMLTAAANAIEAFAHTMLRPEKDATAVVAGGAAHRSVKVARAQIAQINADLGDMLAASLARGVFLGALVVETGRILDELDAGLLAMTGNDPMTDNRRDPVADASAIAGAAAPPDPAPPTDPR
ncbi:MAG: FUSC family protein [Nakamurella sp.]